MANSEMKITSPGVAAWNTAMRRIDGEPLVFTNGVFDLLHRGHVCYLEEAREHGLLLVALNSDASTRYPPKAIPRYFAGNARRTSRINKFVLSSCARVRFRTCIYGLAF